MYIFSINKVIVSKYIDETKVLKYVQHFFHIYENLSIFSCM